jgi:hypothetical protein
MIGLFVIDFISLSSDIDWIEQDVLPRLIFNAQCGLDLVLCHLIDQFSALSHFWYGLWGLAQICFAKLDYDYAFYARRRLNSFKKT